MKKYDIFILAGETSGDIHGKAIIEKLKKINPNLSFVGVTGPEMEKTGIDSILKTCDFSVMGFIDVFFSFFKLLKNFHFLKKEILKINPKACIFIDYPGFNLRMEKALRKKGYTGKIYQYVCPSVWAWKKDRIKTMQKNVDKLFCIYPFEERMLSKYLPCSYVGNPIFDKTRAFLKENEKKGKSKFSDMDLIGLFPGSRKKEIEKNISDLLDSAEHIFQKFPKYYFAISYLNEETKKFIKKTVDVHFPKIKDKILFTQQNENYELMQNLQMAIATSGTINLELAFFKIPTIVIYKISKLDFFIVNKIFRVNLPFYCIVNIIAQRPIFPELYGPNLTKQNLYYYIDKLLREKSFSEKSKNDCEKIINDFEDENIKKNIALEILKEIGN